LSRSETAAFLLDRGSAGIGGRSARAVPGERGGAILARDPAIRQLLPGRHEVGGIVEHEIAVIGGDDEHGMHLAVGVARRGKQQRSDRPALRGERAPLVECVILAIAGLVRIGPIFGGVIELLIRLGFDLMVDRYVDVVERAPALLGERNRRGWLSRRLAARLLALTEIDETARRQGERADGHG